MSWDRLGRICLTERDLGILLRRRESGMQSKGLALDSPITSYMGRLGWMRLGWVHQVGYQDTHRLWVDLSRFNFNGSATSAIRMLSRQWVGLTRSLESVLGCILLGRTVQGSTFFFALKEDQQTTKLIVAKKKATKL